MFSFLIIIIYFLVLELYEFDREWVKDVVLGFIMVKLMEYKRVGVGGGGGVEVGVGNKLRNLWK